MGNFDEMKAELLHGNRPFIPNADINGYQEPQSQSQPRPLSSNAPIQNIRISLVIDSLIWQGDELQRERYERQCRLNQCYNCQKYGHIKTQCKANTVCDYCAEAHGSKECPTKIDKSAIRKCAVCKGAHKAWNKRCLVQKVELSKVKAAYDARQPYHFVPPIKQKQSSESSSFTGRQLGVG